MAAVTTHPCDERAENTGKSEQWRHTGDRALIEEQLERRAEQHKVDPWQKSGGSIVICARLVEGEAYQRRMTLRRARRAQRWRSRWP